MSATIPASVEASLPAAVQALPEAFKIQYIKAYESCTVPAFLEKSDGIIIKSAGWTFQHTILIIGFALAIGVILLSLTLCFFHLINYRNPREQRLIVRLAITPLVFAVVAAISIKYYTLAPWLAPIPQVYESFSLVGLFLLYVTYISPDKSTREQYFDKLTRVRKDNKKNIDPSAGSLKWFHTIWILVFQLPLFRIVTTVATEIILRKFCPLDSGRRKPTSVVTIIQSIDTAVGVLAVIRFHGRFKAELKQHSALFKLITFKGLVGLILLQNAIFAGLLTNGDLKGNQYMSEWDLSVGLPNFIALCEMFIFAFLFLFSFTWAPYKKTQYTEGARPQRKLNIFKAILDVCNIMDVLEGILFMFVALTPASKDGHSRVPLVDHRDDGTEFLGKQTGEGYAGHSMEQDTSYGSQQAPFYDNQQAPGYNNQAYGNQNFGNQGV